MVKKILLGLVILAAIPIISFIVIAAIYASFNNGQKGNHEEILQCSQQPLKKALVVYQPSKSDVSSKIAHQIGKGLNDGGYEVTLNYPGDHLSTDISNYSVIVFGSPTITGKSSKALADYISKIKQYSTDKVALFSVGAMEDIKELDEMEKSLNGKKAYEKKKFFTKDMAASEKAAYDFGKELSK